MKMLHFETILNVFKRLTFHFPALYNFFMGEEVDYFIKGTKNTNTSQ